MLTRTRRSSSAAAVSSGVLWSGASAVLFRMANIVLTAVVVRIVSPHEFGTFAVAVTVYTLVSCLGELGVASYLMRRDLDPNEAAPVVAGLALTSAVAFAAAMAMSATWLARFLGAPEAASSIRVLALAVLVTGIFAVPGALLARDFRQDKIFLSTIIGFVPSSGLLIMLAANGEGAMAFAWSRLVGQLAAGLALAVMARRRYLPRADVRQAARVLRWGLPVAGSNLVNTALLNTDFLIAGRLLGPTALGTYMLAFNVASWTTSVLGAMINGVGIPAFSRIQGDRPALGRAVLRSTRMLASVVFPFAALTCALSGPFIRVLYGESWTGAAPVLSVLAIHGAIFTLTLVYANVLIATGRTARLFVVQVVWMLCLVPLLYLGVRIGGLVGIGVAHALVTALIILPSYVRSMSEATGLHVRELLRALAPAFGQSLLVGAAAWGTSELVTTTAQLPRLLAGGLVGCLCYVALNRELLLAALRQRVLIPELGARPAFQEIPSDT